MRIVRNSNYSSYKIWGETLALEHYLELINFLKGKAENFYKEKQGVLMIPPPLANMIMQFIVNKRTSLN